MQSFRDSMSFSGLPSSKSLKDSSPLDRDAFAVLDDMVRGLDQNSFEDDSHTNIDDDAGSVWEEYKEKLESHYREQEKKKTLRRINRWTESFCTWPFVLCASVSIIVSSTLFALLRADDDNVTTAIIHPMGESLPRPPPSIRDACSDESLATPTGREKCQTLCDVASCCHIPSGLPSSCIETQLSICHDYYTPCRTIFPAFSLDDDKYSTSSSSTTTTSDAITDVDVLPAPRDISQICSSSNIDSVSGFSQCHDICLRAECCTSFPRNCVNNNRETCLQYALPCSSLTIRNVRPNDVVESCDSRNWIAGTAGVGGAERCWAVCSAGACCFAEQFGGGGESCVDQGDHDFCRNFLPCRVLFMETEEDVVGGGGIKNDVSSIKDNLTEEDKKVLIGEICTEEKVATNIGYKSCEDLCKQRRCCYENKSSPSCYIERKDIDNIEWCKGYEPCDVLNEQKDDVSKDNDEQMSSDENDESPVDPVDEVSPNFPIDINFSDINLEVDEEEKSSLVHNACAMESLSSHEGFIMCSKICASRDCCFNKSYNCQAERPEWCFDYIQCRNLDLVKMLNYSS